MITKGKSLWLLYIKMTDNPTENKNAQRIWRDRKGNINESKR